MHKFEYTKQCGRQQYEYKSTRKTDNFRKE